MRVSTGSRPLLPNFGYDGCLARQQGLFDLGEEILADPQVRQVVQQAPGHPGAGADDEPYRPADQADQAPGEQAHGRPDRTRCRPAA